MKQRKMLYTLEKEREKFGAEASDATAKFAAASYSTSGSTKILDGAPARPYPPPAMLLPVRQGLTTPRRCTCP